MLMVAMHEPEQNNAVMPKKQRVPRSKMYGTRPVSEERRNESANQGFETAVQEFWYYKLNA